MAVFMTHSEEETTALGKRIGELLEAGAIVLLYGDLGAGKTVLTRGIAQGLEVKDMVTSPTYTLMHQYEGRLPVYHFDLYRLSGPDEVLDLGYEELFYGSGVSIVEWPERLEHLCPDERVRIDIDIMDYAQSRKITVDVIGAQYMKLRKGLEII